jgi:hypothetical protein
MATQFNWTCPHCGKPQIVTDANFHKFGSYLDLTELNIGDVGVSASGIACLSSECKKLTLNAVLRKWLRRDEQSFNHRFGDVIQEWRLIPESTALPQPDFIPAPLREDYYEACRIRDLRA